MGSLKLCNIHIDGVVAAKVQTGAGPHLCPLVSLIFRCVVNVISGLFNFRPFTAQHASMTIGSISLLILKFQFGPSRTKFFDLLQLLLEIEASVIKFCVVFQLHH